MMLGSMLCSTELIAQMWTTETVVGVGGQVALSNASYSLMTTFGQPVIGTVLKGGDILNQGFWKSQERVSTTEHPLVTGNSEFTLRATENPFSESTELLVTISQRDNITLTLHDGLGREVRRLLDEERSVGSVQVGLSANDLASGYYIVRLTTKNGQQSLRLLLVR